MSAHLLPAKSRLIHSQRSWVIANDQVELAVTRLGGQMAPVTFFRQSTQSSAPVFHQPLAGGRA